MLRKDNFMAPFLYNSTVVCGLASGSLDWSPIHMGSPNKQPRFDSDLNVWLTASHAEIDAYGAFYLLKSFGQVPRSKDTAGDLSGHFCGTTVLHFWYPGKFQHATKGFLQRFLNCCLEEIPWFKTQVFGIAVSLDDDRQEVNIDNCRGNGFVVPSLSVASVERFGQLSKAEWRDEVMNRARRLKAVASVKTLTPPKNQVVISSLGKTENLSWAPAAGPESIFITATPAVEGNGHLRGCHKNLLS